MNSICLIEQYLLDHPLYGVFRFENTYPWKLTGVQNPIKIITDRHSFICSITIVGNNLYGRIGFWVNQMHSYDMALLEIPFVSLIYSRHLGRITESIVFGNIDLFLRDFINEVDEWIKLKIHYTSTFEDFH